MEEVVVGVPEEDAGDDVWREAIDDLVEEICWVGKRVGAVPTCKDMAEDPDAFVVAFSSGEFAGQEAKVAAVLRVGGVDEVEVVGAVPELGVEGDNTEFGVLGVVDAVGCVVHTSLGGSFGRDPVVLLPQSCYMVVIPRLLLAEVT